MHRLRGNPRAYAWGSTDAIPALLGIPTSIEPLAEMWFGAHPSAPSTLLSSEPASDLAELIASDPVAMLGQDVRARFGDTLPYLLKLIAPARPLSLQVHPHLARAREGFAREESAGIPITADNRSYRDDNHKPELVFALTPFEALCGFRAPRRAAELFAELGTPLARRLRELLVAQPSAVGVEAAFTFLLDSRTRPSSEAVEALARECGARLAAGSTSPRADATVVLLNEAYPGDPGVVASLLLNPVSLQPGEALFVPAGGVHAYLSGLGIEIMASSDNVLRAGLTVKHVDTVELLACVDYVAAPPIRTAPEIFHGATRVFYAPVDDFELSVTDLLDEDVHPLPGRGPRTLLCMEGEIAVTSMIDSLVLSRGEAAFVPATEGALTARGRGTLVQADVP
ncbi:mannose-6-phosphate isomerase, class I [Cellulomonas cellasea]|uniref:mannose-6-phosphate isomerase, class I n=1 Tax=Cellulomonas cellasea TaxID=43670 RepID=UPI0025A48F3D|nr:mannose-6-phosphate isomerase, class I [Cellulomonas cellasea]MDM8084695.1 mannose-6-phosphate isomerase, class I [Cellulomonas cellasea]